MLQKELNLSFQLLFEHYILSAVAEVIQEVEHLSTNRRVGCSISGFCHMSTCPLTILPVQVGNKTIKITFPL